MHSYKIGDQFGEGLGGSKGDYGVLLTRRVKRVVISCSKWQARRYGGGEGAEFLCMIFEVYILVSHHLNIVHYVPVKSRLLAPPPLFNCCLQP